MKQSVSEKASVVTTIFAEPTLNAIHKNSIRLIDDPDIAPISDAELEDMAVRLLTLARASGRTITIDNKSDPQQGMGGHYPVVNIRPNYAVVRATLTEQSRREKEGNPRPVPGLKYDQRSLQLLKSSVAPWPDAGDAFLTSLKIDPAFLPHDRVVTIVRELDRRFMQMWDKVGFERAHNLTDYGKLHKQPEQLVKEELPTLYPVLSEAIDSGNNYYLSVFDSRYGRGTIAMLAFDTQFPQVVEDYFSGGDDDNSYIGGLLQLDRYPLAAGKDVHEALRNLDKKLTGITITENTPPFLTWLRYVSDVNTRIKDEKVYEIVAMEAEMILDEQLKDANASGA